MCGLIAVAYNVVTDLTEFKKIREFIDPSKHKLFAAVTCYPPELEGKTPTAENTTYSCYRTWRNHGIDLETQTRSMYLLAFIAVEGVLHITRDRRVLINATS